MNKYVDMLLAEWGMDGLSPSITAEVRRVLRELSAESLLRLRDPRLQVVIHPAAGFSVWAFFPVHCRRTIVKELAAEGVLMRPTTRVLLLIGAGTPDEDEGGLADYLRDHLGHTLLYLRHPRAKNECEDALREWRAQ